ncbi:MAG: hypothetical protein QOE92_2414 [Chloroflexota bacterium]|jgi:AcrR family transcriptional regulator|nr:hypothetical protein [Chloroflexota bacterium]
MESPAIDDLPLRQRQALETRRRIATAARALFAERGYVETSMDAIARAAGVAPRTVYNAYGSKRFILGAVCALWLEQAGVREAWARAAESGRAAERLALVAEINRRLWEHGIDIVRVLQAAAPRDPMAERLRHGWTDDTAGGLRELLGGIKGSFRAGLELETAMVLVRALCVPEVYMELAGQGWTPDRYQAWLTGALGQQVLGSRPSRTWP